MFTARLILASHSLEFFVYNDTDYQQLDIQEAWEPGVWVHLVVSIDWSAGGTQEKTWVAYKDGAQVNVTSSSSNGVLSGIFPKPVNCTVNSIGRGSRKQGVFQGFIDDFVLLRRGVNKDEATIMFEGLGFSRELNLVEQYILKHENRVSGAGITLEGPYKVSTNFPLNNGRPVYFHVDGRFFVWEGSRWIITDDKWGQGTHKVLVKSEKKSYPFFAKSYDINGSIYSTGYDVESIGTGMHCNNRPGLMFSQSYNGSNRLFEDNWLCGQVRFVL